MLERVTTKEGVVYYRSAKLKQLGVPHGFSTRIGGISQAPFASLNLGNPNGCPVQDDRANIAANYDRLHQAIGADGRSRWFVHQVHGDVVAAADAGSPFDCNQKADAVVCGDKGAVAAIRVADCVPLLMATDDGSVVAAVHAGWRGVVAGVALQALERLCAEARTAADRITVAIGPSISLDAFEVGPEVLVEFERSFGGDAAALVRPSANGGKAMIDLRGALVTQLQSAGVSRSRIEVSDRCTMRDADEFFSHRRENGVTGRMAALIGPVS